MYTYKHQHLSFIYKLWATPGENLPAIIKYVHLFVLFDLILYVPSTIFQL